MIKFAVTKKKKKKKKKIERIWKKWQSVSWYHTKKWYLHFTKSEGAKTLHLKWDTSLPDRSH